MKKYIASIVVIATLATTSSVTFAEESSSDREGPKTQIVDVTNGAEIRGVSTPDDASGYGRISYIDDNFSLQAIFEGLNDPVGDDFYEGWLVQQSPFKFISTGEVIKKEDGKYHNNFESGIDYTSYDFYVLTLEPNDGNPDPAAHILEGNVSIVSAEDYMKKDHKDLTDSEKALRASIKTRISALNLSTSRLQGVLENLDTVRGTLSSRNLSASTLELYNDVLDAAEDVLHALIAGK